MKKHYRYIDHTADLGIEVWARSAEDLFANIGHAIFETQIAGDVHTDIERHITLQAGSLEDLFVDWCRELLYNFSVEGFIPAIYDVEIDGFSLDAHLHGERFDPQRHRVKIEIKNPTYHNLMIEGERNGVRAKIIFDV